ncbi:MAG TPA: aminotransferase class I/II-fold pyridoxal phosphate-dependent enzyme [Gemmatimonadaceae bacterium]|nr:aminotransferase class I/II-fold pyridoxal phosphate-dependent enzyme [Gemmatimonadaceae bacterium]
MTLDASTNLATAADAGAGAPPSAPSAADRSPSRVSRAANSLRASQILRIAAEIRALTAAGRSICNLTVGDFSPREFPAPAELVAGLQDALRAGETNYPPSSGLPELRDAIATFSGARLGLSLTGENVVVASGARPAIYAAYRTLLDPGDAVVYPAPSWNNADYCQIVGATPRPVVCSAADSFLPTRASLESPVRGARLLVLNSPLNPAGTAFDAATLRDICELVLAENKRRGAGERPLFLLYDQVYWMLTLGDVRHVHPTILCPEIEPYVITVDAISKAFAATGVRVGWAMGPADVMRHMADFLSHVGAWAPRAAQIATARLLGDAESVDTYHQSMHAAIAARLGAIHTACTAMHTAGLPVTSLPPTGTIYGSVRLELDGRLTRDGRVLRGSEDVRRYLLKEANLAVIPFQAFGVPDDGGWFRFSIGAVSVPALESGLARMRAAIE